MGTSFASFGGFSERLEHDPKRGVLRYAASENADEEGELRTRIVAEDPEGARVVFLSPFR